MHISTSCLRLACSCLPCIHVYLLFAPRLLNLQVRRETELFAEQVERAKGINSMEERHKRKRDEKGVRYAFILLMRCLVFASRVSYSTGGPRQSGGPCCAPARPIGIAPILELGVFIKIKKVQNHLLTHPAYVFGIYLHIFIQ
jgi:hypothetical protein